MNCAQVKEQLVDYLYGELPAPARSAFVEHLRGCPGCHAEVAGHEQALARTRSALTGSLLQEPPARVRLAVMAAAKAGVRSAHRAERDDRPGFFARLLRTPWLLPAVGAASVATVVFVVRVLKNPEVVPGQRPATLMEDGTPAAAPVPPAEPEPRFADERKEQPAEHLRPEAAKSARPPAQGLTGTPAATAPSRRLMAPHRGRASTLQRRAGGAGAGKADGFAAPPSGWNADRPTARARDDDALGAVNGIGKVPAPAEAAPAPPRSRSAPGQSEGRSLGRPPAPVMPMVEKKSSEATARPASPAPAEAALPAAAPSPMAAPPPPAPAASAPTYAAPKSRSVDLDLMESEATAAARPADKEPSKAKAERSAKGAAGPPAAGPSLEQDVGKAARLFASHDWAAAAAAYRELLRRYPGHKDAATWRERMGQSLVAAEEQTRATRGAKTNKAAKAKSSDALIKE